MLFGMWYYCLSYENQIGNFLLEYNVKHTVKYLSEHRTEKVHSIEDDKENPFNREWRKCRDIQWITSTPCCVYGSQAVQTSMFASHF